MAAPRSLTVFSSSVLQTPSPDAAFAFIVQTAGGNYQGLWQGDESLGLETVVLFDDHLGSTLGLRLSEFSYCNVLQRLEESAKRWARGRA